MGWRRQKVSGGVLALFYALLVFGGLYAAFAEGGASNIRHVYAASTATDFPTPLPQITNSPSLKPNLTPTPSPSNCHPPEGWTAITIHPEDTLISLAELYQSTPKNLTEANCLLNTTLSPGSIFFIPSAQNP